MKANAASHTKITSVQDTAQHFTRSTTIKACRGAGHKQLFFSELHFSEMTIPSECTGVKNRTCEQNSDLMSNLLTAGQHLLLICPNCCLDKKINKSGGSSFTENSKSAENLFDLNLENEHQSRARPTFHLICSFKWF